MVVFRAVFLLDAVLCWAAALAVAVSMVLPGRAPQGVSFWLITAGIGFVFAIAGWMSFGAQRHLVRLYAGLGGEARRQLRRAARYLTGGAGLLGVIVALCLYVILARIDQRLALFG